MDQHPNVGYLDMGHYVVRSLKEEDVHDFVTLDPSMNSMDLEAMLRQGFSFAPQTNGVAGFVAQDKRSGKIIGRSYAKTWHPSLLRKPKFRLNEKGGFDLVQGAGFAKKEEHLVELGGWYIHEEYRGGKQAPLLNWMASLAYYAGMAGIGLYPTIIDDPDMHYKDMSKALVYASIAFVHQAHKLGQGIDAVIISNIGPFMARDNEQGVAFNKRLFRAIREKGLLHGGLDFLDSTHDHEDLTHEQTEILIDQLHILEGMKEVLTKEEVAENLKGLTVYQKIKGELCKVPYFFGAPRKVTGPAYALSQKLARGEFSVETSHERLTIPNEMRFVVTNDIHTFHGGRYTVSVLNGNKE